MRRGRSPSESQPPRRVSWPTPTCGTSSPPWSGPANSAGFATEVDPILEITEITDRVSKRGGPALLFERVKGSSMPVLINAFGSPSRMNLALQVGVADGRVRRNSRRSWTSRPRRACSASSGCSPSSRTWPAPSPKPSRTAPARRSSSATTRPWQASPSCSAGPRTPDDTSPSPWSSPRTPTPAPGTAARTGCRSSTSGPPGCTGISRRAARPTTGRRSAAGRRVEVGVAIGADPAVCFAGTLPLPEGIDEMLVAGFLRKKPVEMVRCETVDVEVPGQRRDRPGRLRGHRGAAHRGALRRPHRLLLAGRHVPGLPPHLPHAPPKPDLPHHHRRPAAHGRLPHGGGHRGALPAHHARSSSPRSWISTCPSRASSTTWSW